MLDEQYRAILVSSACRTVSDDVATSTRDDAMVSVLPHRATTELIKGVVSVAMAQPAAVNDTMLTGLGILIRHLEVLQLDNGLFGGGDNLVSPPDSGFTINDICLTLELMERYPCPQPVADMVREPLMVIARKAAPAMLAGGVHTPNHRWEISSALVGLYTVLDDKRLLDRAKQWLAESIDIQSDGLYSERSPNYAAYVTNSCLIAMARRLGRDDFLDLVERNLEAIAGLMQPDGMLETIQSRRQDQFEPYDPAPFLSQARLLANVCANPSVVELAHELSGRGILDPARHLAEALIDSRIVQALPSVFCEPGEGPRIKDYLDTRMSRVVLSGSMVRPHATATVYAGSDFIPTFRVASGLANNPSLMDFHTKDLGVATVRIEPDFFGLGPLRPEHMRHTGMRWVLEERRTSGYYQPLDPADVRPDGCYPLANEGRFFAQMAFDRRERDDMTLTSTITVDLDPMGFGLTAHMEGPTTVYACVLGIVGDNVIVRGGAKRAGDGWVVQMGQDVVVESNATRMTLSHMGDDAATVCSYDPGEAVNFTGGNDRIPGIRLELRGSTAEDLRLNVRFESLEGTSA